MKRITKLLFITIIGISILTFTSCNDDDNEDIKPNETDKVFNGNPNFSSLQDLKDFSAENYSIVNGDIEIGYIENLNDLSLLSNLKRVHGSLQLIVNAELENLEGLNNLDTVSGAFNIISCTKLRDFKGLDNLVYIGGDMRIMGNDVLENLEGINKLKYVGEKLKLSSNPNLVNLSGLESLEIIGLMLEIGELDGSGNEKLESLEALSSLKEITTRLEINQNPKLVNLNGFEKLEILGTTKIIHNTLLSDFCSLSTVLSHGGQTGVFLAVQNEYNPSAEDIISGDCSK